MPPTPLAAAAVALAYLVGSIPFAYLVVYAVRRVDIRTVGSGNVGATNAGRLLGAKYFFLVFALDMLKGLLPTLLLPTVAARLAGGEVPGLPVYVALAAIVGHNFPIYLGFRGGKGVATSFGALAALDPPAIGVAGVGFVIFLLVSKYVSLSSILAGFVFASAHFRHVDHLWSRREAPMTVATLALLVLLIVRHRKNFARIAAGTEPKVLLRQPKGRREGAEERPEERAPSGKVSVLILVTLAILSAGAVAVQRISRPATLDGPRFTLTVADRARTGLQRAERLVFLDEGRRLAVACPRYNRVLLYRVSDRPALEPGGEVVLEGRPVALAAAAGRLYVLQRPAADARHLEEGWWEAFDRDGRRVGAKFRVGFDPDDLALTDDGRLALVLTSGRAEGEANRPDPALLIVDLSGSGPRLRSRLVFDGPRDDPERVALRPGAGEAAVSLRGSNRIARIDLSNLDHPRVAGRDAFPGPGGPGALAYGADGALLASDAGGGGLWRIESGGVARRLIAGAGDFAAFRGPGRGLILALDLGASALTVAEEGRVLGRLPLRGLANLGSVRPTGLAVATRDSGPALLAASDRSGGVHLIALRPKGASY